MKNRIRQLREEKGMHQEDLAKELNLSISTVSRYECGQLDISTKALLKMKAIFGCSTDYILGV